MGELVEEYFSRLFSTSSSIGFNEILKGILPTISEEMNIGLNREFCEEEVHAVLQQMAPLTTPRSDGMSPTFYKSFWHIVGKDDTKATLAILNKGIILKLLIQLSFP